MGNLGKAFLIISLFAIIMTSLIGNIFGLSNLLHSMAEEKVLPTFLAKVDKNGNPLGAIIFIAIISMVMTFFGRIVIGWIVDINNICGVIIYTYIAACAIKSAAKEQNKLSLTLGIIGVVLGVGFALTITIPNIVGDSEIAKESFIILVVWAILGFIYFQFILKNDKNNAYGHSIAVWLGLLSLIIFSAAIWLMDMIKDSDLELMNKISEYVSGQPVSLEDEYIRAIRSDTNVRVIVATSISVLILLVTQVIFFRFFIVLKKKEVEQQRLKDIAEEKATKDAMTGVRNKLAYSYKEKELDNFIAQDLLDLQFAVVVCDVNNLKYINDNLGHEYGDKLIKNAAEIICTVFEHSPVFRIGGDEFVVIIEGKDYENRKELLERLNAISEENNHVEGETVIAAGLATFDKNEHNEFMSVFRDADQNMYSRKMKLKEERNYPRS